MVEEIITILQSLSWGWVVVAGVVGFVADYLFKMALSLKKVQGVLRVDISQEMQGIHRKDRVIIRLFMALLIAYAIELVLVVSGNVYASLLITDAVFGVAFIGILITRLRSTARHPYFLFFIDGVEYLILTTLIFFILSVKFF